MCFSAEASFTAAAILTVAGVVLVKKFYPGKVIFLALIPLFLGFQQFAEGVLWETLKHEGYPKAYSLAAQYIFLFFAYMFWPIWIPLAFGLVEKVKWRQIVMLSLIVIGLCFFFKSVYSFIFDEVVKARILEHSIAYGIIPVPYRIVYGVVILTPFYLSSIPKMWILGIANTLAFVIADISYHYAFTSVWCAACAIVIIGFFLILKKDSIKPIEKINR